MNIIVLLAIVAIVLVLATYAYERFVPMSIKETINDMMRIIKGK